MSETTKAGAAPKRTIFQRLRDALRADAALHDITDAQFMNGEDPLTARPVLPDETPATMTSDADAHRVIRQIAECAENVAFAAGVGSLETAGQIVSFLWARPSLMADFMAGKLDAIDTGLLDHHNGVLS